MEDSWQGIMLLVALYSLGVLGYFGITLLPLRSAMLLRRNLFLWRSSRLGKVAFVVVGITAVIAIVLALTLTVDISRCLLGYHCSADRSGGWLALAGVGFLYAAFELVAFVVLLVGRKLARVAT